MNSFNTLTNREVRVGLPTRHYSVRGRGGSVARGGIVWVNTRPPPRRPPRLTFLWSRRHREGRSRDSWAEEAAAPTLCNQVHYAGV